MLVDWSDALTARNLRDLATELARGVVPLRDASFKLVKLQWPAASVELTTRWLRALDGRGWSAAQAAEMVALLAAERERRERARDDIELVWSGPDALGAESRDSARKLEELFARATQSVLLAGYNLRPGAHFDALAEAARRVPALTVAVFAHVFTDARPTMEGCLAAHDEGLRATLRGVDRARVTAHRPSAERLAEAREGRFHMHAKCVTVDDRFVLVTSANFSFTAQERNVEVGVALDDRRLARRIRDQFDTLVKRGDMTPHAYG